jgi:hypothetical protein
VLCRAHTDLRIRQSPGTQGVAELIEEAGHPRLGRVRCRLRNGSKLQLHAAAADDFLPMLRDECMKHGADACQPFTKYHAHETALQPVFVTAPWFATAWDSWSSDVPRRTALVVHRPARERGFVHTRQSSTGSAASVHIRTDVGDRVCTTDLPQERKTCQLAIATVTVLMYTDSVSGRHYAAGWTRRRAGVRLADSGARITRKPKAAAASPSAAPEVPAMFGLQRYLFGAAAVIAIASTTALSATQSPPSRASDNDVKQVIAQLEKHAQLFQFSLTSAPDVEWLAGERGTGDIDRFVTSFVNATRQLRQHHGRGQVVTSRVDEVLRRGASIDSFMEHRRSPNQVEQDWLTVRRDLETLARAYNVIWHRRAPYSSVTTSASAAR